MHGDGREPNPRNARKARWAQSARVRLILELGGRCAVCAATFDDAPKKVRPRSRFLELDHPGGRDWDVRRKSQWGRMAIYRREAAAGKLRVLCKTCNARDGQAKGTALRRARRSA